MRTPLLLAALVVLGSVPAAAQDVGTFEIGDLPDLAEALRARPPMGECPVGHTDERAALPRASHLLHLGVASFYLDFHTRLSIDAEQAQELGRLRDKATRAWARDDEELGRLELQLWEATGALQPDLARVDALVREVEAVRARQRIEYIRAVAVAASKLREDQQRALVGLRRAAK